MIFTLLLYLGIMSMAPAEEPIETNANTVDLDIMQMVQVEEMLVVIERTHTPDTTFRCLSALNKGRLSNRLYKYALKARNGTAIDAPYVEHIVNVSLAPLLSSSGYSSSYTDHAGTTFTMTLKQKDSNGTCFVIYVRKSTGQKGCELLLRASALHTGIAVVCDTYFTKHCPEPSIELHRDDCIYDESN
uniref:Putative conserved secreted protein n=1 Tax=Amblyomma tuberculatum TaxID=48802 RepID=A0A6M2E4N8_9ACAR